MALVLQCLGAPWGFPNVDRLHAKIFGRVYKRQNDGNYGMAALANGIHALLGRDSASDFDRFAQNVGVGIFGMAELLLALQSPQVPLEVHRLPAIAHQEFAKDPFTYLGQVKKWLLIVFL